MQNARIKNEKRNDDVDGDGEEVQHFLYIQTPDRPHQRLLLVVVIVVIVVIV